MAARNSNVVNPVQCFCPSSIETAQGGTVFDVSDMLAIRISESVEYYINSDVAHKATMPAGATAIDTSVSSLTFTHDTIVEVMR